MSSQDRTRDHLANERTFLAWIRTSLGLMGLGFVLARMGVFLRQITGEATSYTPNNAHSGHEFLVAGIIFLVIGTLIAGVSAWLHDRNRKAIDSATYQPARKVILGLTAIIVAGGIAVIALVVWRIQT